MTSIALAQAAKPLGLEITTGFLREPLCAAAAVAIAAEPANHSLRFIMIRALYHISEMLGDVTIQVRMTEKVSPAKGVHGVVGLPGDKSISHRYAMLTSIADGDSEIHNYSTGADCRSTLTCMQALGVNHDFSEIDGRRVLTVHGKGIAGLQAAAGTLDAGNSGSTIRMLSGILAAQPFTTSLTGDESLVKRPMKRIMTPLAEMGARIEATNGQFPPLTIHGSRLHGIDYSGAGSERTSQELRAAGGTLCGG